jgi:hypothetical protein
LRRGCHCRSRGDACRGSGCRSRTCGAEGGQEGSRACGCAKETAGKQRFHTCVDQYNANKTTGGNGGLVWIKKGDSYYSECNKRLKG